VDVLAQQDIVAIIFGDALVAIPFGKLRAGCAVLGHLAIDVLGDPPAGGVVGVGDLLPVGSAARSRHTARPLDGVDPAGALRRAGVLVVLPLERVRARWDREIPRPGPRAALRPTGLEILVDIEGQGIPTDRGHLVPEADVAGPDDRRLHPGLLPGADGPALCRVVVGIILDRLGEPLGVATGGEAQFAVAGGGQRRWDCSPDCRILCPHESSDHAGTSLPRGHDILKDPIRKRRRYGRGGDEWGDL